IEVAPRARHVTEFRVHNVLDEEPPGTDFDFILCRNVAIYFAPEVVPRLCTRIARALAPGGIALFGPLDVSGVPSGLVRTGPPELNAFMRATHAEVRPTPRIPADSTRMSWRPSSRGKIAAPPSSRQPVSS